MATGDAITGGNIFSALRVVTKDSELTPEARDTANATQAQILSTFSESERQAYIDLTDLLRTRDQNPDTAVVTFLQGFANTMQQSPASAALLVRSAEAGLASMSPEAQAATMRNVNYILTRTFENVSDVDPADLAIPVSALIVLDMATLGGARDIRPSGRTRNREQDILSVQNGLESLRDTRTIIVENHKLSAEYGAPLPSRTAAADLPELTPAGNPGAAGSRADAPPETRAAVPSSRAQQAR